MTLIIPRELFEVVRSVLLLDDASELLVARAEGSTAGIILTGTAGAFQELADYVAAEANAEPDKRRMRLLDEACKALDTALPAE